MADVEKLLVPESKHSITGPSGADRWMNCAGSPNLIRKIIVQYGPEAGSIEAEEGTAAHTVLTHCLTTNDDAWVHAGKEVHIGKNIFTVDDDMVEGVQLAIDTVRALRKEYPNGIAYIERVLKSDLDPDAWGAGDIIYEVPSVAIFVLDFKFGQGKCVEATAPQMKQYGYMAYEQRGPHMRGDANEPQKIITGVIQPRIPHPKGPVRWHTYDVQEVEDWFVSDVLPALEATRDPQATLVMGDWCQFCPGKKRNKCPALQSALIEAPTDLEPKSMTADELGDAIAKFDLLISMQERLENEAFQRMLAGEAIKNRKLVNKKANRVFKPEITRENPETGKTETVKLEDALTVNFGLDAWTEPTMKTPPKIEELPMGKEFVARWAYKPDAGLTIAPMSDNRSAVRPLMERMDEAPVPMPEGKSNGVHVSAAGIPI